MLVQASRENVLKKVEDSGQLGFRREETIILMKRICKDYGIRSCKDDKSEGRLDFCCDGRNGRKCGIHHDSRSVHLYVSASWTWKPRSLWMPSQRARVY